MKTQFTAERRNKLAQMVISKGSITVNEAAEYFHVTTETIRKDFIFLDKEGILKKSRGGATVVHEVIEKPVSQKEIENLDAKRRIALKALSYITPKSTIILDSGSTVLELAKLLKLDKGLTIFTNSASVIHQLAESKHDVFTVGGKIRSSSLAIVGDWANQQISSIRCDFTFLGTDGCLNFNGPTSTAYDESVFKKNLLSLGKNILLIDSSKFHAKSLFQYGTWSDINLIITDNNIDTEVLAEIKKCSSVDIV